jgi:shikimate kinase
MKLILLYGPPASGKLTIARELVKRTGFKLLHNHQTFDLIEPLFGALHPQFNPLLNSIRHSIISAAARAGIKGLIVTHVYGPEEADFMRALEASVIEHGGQAHFVRLVTSPEELARRVQDDSRQEHSKLQDPKDLQQLMADWDVTQEIPGTQTLTIDNTNLTAAQVAEQLVTKLKLP